MNRRFLHITCAFLGVVAVLILVWLFCYKPNLGSELSGENADWGNFGQFFFGLGTLLVAIVTAYVMLGIDTQLHRSGSIKLYEKTLRRFRTTITKDIMEISPYELKTAYMDMYMMLAIIELDKNFSRSVNKKAEDLFNETIAFSSAILTIEAYLKEAKNKADFDEHFSETYTKIASLISDLSGFIVCLSTNDGTTYKDIINRYQKEIENYK